MDPGYTYGHEPVRHFDEDDLKSDPGDRTSARPQSTADSSYSKQPVLPRLEIFDQSTPSKPDNFRVSPATPLPNWDADDTWTPIENDSARYWDSALTDLSERTLAPTGTTSESDLDAVLANWSGRGTHVDFQSHEEVPLVQGRFLGHGSMGSVFETNVQGHTFAWKRRFCRRKIGEAERKEIEILKKVSHHHIIRFAGSYSHRQFLGLLLYPVAVCDLATFLEDFESLLPNSDRDSAREERMTALGLSCRNLESEFYRCSLLLARRMGCIISAVEYLHSQSIRHKDLKPSNILLSAENLWLTDFGTATDFSDQTMSTTEGIERGTPKYFAPEVAAYEGSGRPADIFSLGCVLLEMYTSQQVAGLKMLRDLRSQHDKSFQANLESIYDWLSQPAKGDVIFDHQIKYQVRKMLARESARRPTIGHVREAFALIDTAQEFSGNQPLFGVCCRRLFLSKERHDWLVENERTRTAERVRGEMQKTIDDLRKERDQLQHRTIELQQTVDQQMWNLNAWVQRDALRLNEEATMDDIRTETRSAELPAQSTARALRKLKPMSPESFSRPSSLNGVDGSREPFGPSYSTSKDVSADEIDEDTQALLLDHEQWQWKYEPYTLDRE
ncbi:uncharacterized protein N0V89_002057 [Didymosphaeria variabile]|uniref:Protein kinase domain-containing protein n=1 Tax=Didymosphaeria variabile TaxID=1932322 RepID=A0A9W8XRD9_9PLEO|nr:uncharacterized protein N0V89_002057 [Didymosphaeria variabile]KAJ4357481.1 hypothetical protein N0V89_002057 [Didymosphaeria variabile]